MGSLTHLLEADHHLSYLGETILHIGLALLVHPHLPSVRRLQAVVWLAPISTYLLLRYFSGVPPLEEDAEGKWGGDERWREYCDRVQVFFPWPGGFGRGKAV